MEALPSAPSGDPGYKLKSALSLHDQSLGIPPDPFSLPHFPPTCPGCRRGTYQVPLKPPPSLQKSQQPHQKQPHQHPRRKQTSAAPTAFKVSTRLHTSPRRRGFVDANSCAPTARHRLAQQKTSSLFHRLHSQWMKRPSNASWKPPCAPQTPVQHPRCNLSENLSYRRLTNQT